MTNERRSEDPRIAQMAHDITVLQMQMMENTAVTVQVRDMLAGIKLFATVSKWGFAVAASIAAAWAAIKGVK